MSKKTSCGGKSTATAVPNAKPTANPVASVGIDGAMKSNAGGSCEPTVRATLVCDDLITKLGCKFSGKVNRPENLQNVAVLSGTKPSSSAVKSGKPSAVCSSVRAAAAAKAVKAKASDKETRASKKTTSGGKPSSATTNAELAAKHVANEGINGATKLSAGGSCEPAVKAAVICEDLTINANRPGNMQNVAVLSGTQASSRVLLSGKFGSVCSSVRSDSAAKAEVEKRVTLHVSIISSCRYSPMRGTNSLALLSFSIAKTFNVGRHPNVTSQLCAFPSNKRKSSLNLNVRHDHMKKILSPSSNVRKSKIEVNSPLLAIFGNGRSSHGVFSAFLPRRCRLRRFCTLWISLRACRRP